MKRNIGSAIVKKAIIWAMTFMMAFAPAVSSIGTMTVYAAPGDKTPEGSGDNTGSTTTESSATESKSESESTTTATSEGTSTTTTTTTTSSGSDTRDVDDSEAGKGETDPADAVISDDGSTSVITYEDGSSIKKETVTTTDTVDSGSTTPSKDNNYIAVKVEETKDAITVDGEVVTTVEGTIDTSKLDEDKKESLEALIDEAEESGFSLDNSSNKDFVIEAIEKGEEVVVETVNYLVDEQGNVIKDDNDEAVVLEEGQSIVNGEYVKDRDGNLVMLEKGQKVVTFYVIKDKEGKEVYIPVTDKNSGILGEEKADSDNDGAEESSVTVKPSQKETKYVDAYIWDESVTDDEGYHWKQVVVDLEDKQGEHVDLTVHDKYWYKFDYKGKTYYIRATNTALEKDKRNPDKVIIKVTKETVPVYEVKYTDYNGGPAKTVTLKAEDVADGKIVAEVRYDIVDEKGNILAQAVTPKTVNNIAQGNYVKHGSGYVVVDKDNKVVDYYEDEIISAIEGRRVTFRPVNRYYVSTKDNFSYQSTNKGAGYDIDVDGATYHLYVNFAQNINKDNGFVVCDGEAEVTYVPGVEATEETDAKAAYVKVKVPYRTGFDDAVHYYEKEMSLDDFSFSRIATLDIRVIEQKVSKEKVEFTATITTETENTLKTTTSYEAGAFPSKVDGGTVGQATTYKDNKGNPNGYEAVTVKDREGRDKTEYVSLYRHIDITVEASVGKYDAEVTGVKVLDCEGNEIKMLEKTGTDGSRNDKEYQSEHREAAANGKPIKNLRSDKPVTIIATLKYKDNKGVEHTFKYTVSVYPVDSKEAQGGKDDSYNKCTGQNTQAVGGDVGYYKGFDYTISAEELKAAMEQHITTVKAGSETKVDRTITDSETVNVPDADNTWTDSKGTSSKQNIVARFYVRLDNVQQMENGTTEYSQDLYTLDLLPELLKELKTSSRTDPSINAPDGVYVYYNGNGYEVFYASPKLDENGEPVLDENGEPLYEVLDKNGNTILGTASKVVEGREPGSTDYDTIEAALSDYLSSDVWKKIEQKYFSGGYSEKVMTNNGKVKSTPNEIIASAIEKTAMDKIKETVENIASGLTGTNGQNWTIGDTALDNVSAETILKVIENMGKTEGAEEYAEGSPEAAVEAAVKAAIEKAVADATNFQYDENGNRLSDLQAFIKWYVLKDESNGNYSNGKVNVDGNIIIPEFTININGEDIVIPEIIVVPGGGGGGGTPDPVALAATYTIEDEGTPLAAGLPEEYILEDEPTPLSDSVPVTGDSTIPVAPVAATGIGAALAALYVSLRKKKN